MKLYLMASNVLRYQPQVAQAKNACKADDYEVDGYDVAKKSRPEQDQYPGNQRDERSEGESHAIFLRKNFK